MIASGSITPSRILSLDEWTEDTPEDRAVKDEFKKVAEELRVRVEAIERKRKRARIFSFD